MSLAAVLARRGIGTAHTALSPLSPPAPSERGQPETAHLLLVPTVPTVPGENVKGAQRIPAVPMLRPVLHFRLNGHQPNEWATALGSPGESLTDLRKHLAEKYGGRLAEVRKCAALADSPTIQGNTP